MQSLIGGIQSNLVVGEITFRVKPNYFVSINDKGIKKQYCLKNSHTKMPTVQVPILLGSSSKQEEQKMLRFVQMNIDSDTIFFSYNQNKIKYCYIEIIFEFLGCKPYSFHALIDTEATTSVCQPNALPAEF
ncbi:hypothetical protein ACH5RR_007199 [Cinchona calisaya]|uniref:Uncharacterized protein n=1 Tax=Cinchona calisaya TaxID=153742 RepID=A0ABD3AR46_9GENT